jgi:hypothetical protein
MNKETCIKEISGMICVAGEALLKDDNEVLKRKIDALIYARDIVREKS